MHDRAVRQLNAGQYRDAVVLLEDLLERQPDRYTAYQLYWRALGKIGTGDACRLSIRRTIERFDTVPSESRTEAFYATYLHGAELLEQTALSESIRAEAVRRYPRGAIAQLQRLEEAQRQAVPDPVQSASLYRSYIDDFPQPISRAQSAASRRFRVIAQHPEAFSRDELHAAAEESYQLVMASIDSYGNPSRGILELFEVANLLLDVDLDGALEWAGRGVRFVEETADSTEEFDLSAAQRFLGLQLLALTRSSRWSEVVVVAQRLGLDGHAEVDLPPAIVGFGEAELRSSYAGALTELGQFEAAAMQLAFAAALDQSFAARRDEFLSRNPSQRKGLESGVRRFELARRGVRREDLLTSEVRRPAPDFSLVDLTGQAFVLSHLRGRVVVLAFFATWCGPCKPELDELAHAMEKHDPAAVQFLAVSTDYDKSLVAPFVAEHGYRFPVLYTDGTVEEPYDVATQIPQLYVIDREGNIRFHRVGFEAGRFAEYLDWMVEAAGS